jgi:hypothetical protein
LGVRKVKEHPINSLLDISLENNIGTVSELAGRIFEDTDWTVDASEIIPQTLDETLIEVIIDNDWVATKLKNDNFIAPSEQPGCSIPSGSTVFLFYSCCKNKTDRLQFIYVPKDEVISKDSDRIITNKNSQYYIDNMTYIESEQSKKYGLY